MADAPPLISVIVPIRNEREHIAAAIASLRAQRREGFELELLLVDGDSDDGTTDIVAAIATEEPEVRLLHNPQRRTPFAMNIGLHAARGELVAILGAHAEYDPDYLATCLRELEARQVTGVSGRVVAVPLGPRPADRLNCWTISHRFGSSGRSFRTLPEGEVDTLPYPLFRKPPLLELGGYDEHLLRNQDNDMNQRLRDAGHRLYLTHATSARYRFRPGLRGLLRYADTGGRWNAVSLRRSPRSMKPHHLAPAALPAAALLAPPAGLVLRYGAGFPSSLAWPLAIVPLLLHLAIGSIAAVGEVVRHRSALALLLPLWFLLFHLAYGWGLLRGLAVGGRPPAET